MIGNLLDTASKVCLLFAFVLLMPITALTIAQAVYGYHSYTLPSHAMEPSLAAGSLVVSQPVSARELTVGDVIAFHSPGRASDLVTRRVVAITSDHLVVTRADSALDDDAWRIRQSAVVDREALAVPVVGYPAAWLQTRIGRFLFLVLPAAMFALLLVNSTLRRRRPRPALLEAA